MRFGYLHEMHRTYIFDLTVEDYTAKVLRDTAIFVQEVTPNVPFIRPVMHITGRSMLVLLHKLRVRPAL